MFTNRCFAIYLSLILILFPAGTNCSPSRPQTVDVNVRDLLAHDDNPEAHYSLVCDNKVIYAVFNDGRIINFTITDEYEIEILNSYQYPYHTAPADYFTILDSKLILYSYDSEVIYIFDFVNSTELFNVHAPHGNILFTNDEDILLADKKGRLIDYRFSSIAHTEDVIFTTKAGSELISGALVQGNMKYVIVRRERDVEKPEFKVKLLLSKEKDKDITELTDFRWIRGWDQGIILFDGRKLLIYNDKGALIREFDILEGAEDINTLIDMNGVNNFIFYANKTFPGSREIWHISNDGNEWVAEKYIISDYLGSVVMFGKFIFARDIMNNMLIYIVEGGNINQVAKFEYSMDKGFISPVPDQ